MKHHLGIDSWCLHALPAWTFPKCPSHNPKINTYQAKILLMLDYAHYMTT